MVVNKPARKITVKLKDLIPDHFYDRILYHNLIETYKAQVQQLGLMEFLKTHPIRVKQTVLVEEGKYHVIVGWLTVVAIKELHTTDEIEVTEIEA